jgi:putative DNA primase/helicase
MCGRKHTYTGASIMKKKLDDRRKLVVCEAPDDPHRLARLYVRRFATHSDGLTLRYWRGEWYRWADNAYRPVPKDELRARVAAFVKRYFNSVNRAEQRRGNLQPLARKVTVGLVSNVLQALAGAVVLPDGTPQHAWLGPDSFGPPDEVLVTSNALVHLPTLRTRPPTPRLFTANALDYPFDPNAAEPSNWVHFLGGLWPDDTQSVQLLQEWFGYYLVPDTRQQKMVLLVGPKRSGKGTIARVLKGLVGQDNVAAPTLSSLATSFGLWPLLGRTVAIIPDARLSGRADATVITERLLSISGEDM